MPLINPKAMSTLGHTFRNFDQTIITVRIGSDNHVESFSCHRELLRRCSTYFDRVLEQQSSSPYKGGGLLLEIKDTKPDVFDAFMMWLYTGFIPHHLIEGGSEVEPPISVDLNRNVSNAAAAPILQSPKSDENIDTASWAHALEEDDCPAEENKAPEEIHSSLPNQAEKVSADSDSVGSTSSPPIRLSGADKPELPKETLCPCCSRPYKWRSLEGFLERRFISLYIFAHRYGIPRLRRAVILAWQTNDEILQSMPDHSNVIDAYESLPADSPLCLYFLDMYSVYWNPAKDNHRMAALRSQLPQPFLFELATALAKGERPKVEKDWCDWHEHEDEDAKRACTNEMMKDAAAAKAIKRLRDTKGWKGLVMKKGKR